MPILPIPFTVADALQLDVFKAVRVLAGANSLERPIQRVRIVEIPNIERWVNGQRTARQPRIPRLCGVELSDPLVGPNLHPALKAAQLASPVRPHWTRASPLSYIPARRPPAGGTPSHDRHRCAKKT
jgi:hypothetical protein